MTELSVEFQTRWPVIEPNKGILDQADCVQLNDRTPLMSFSAIMARDDSRAHLNVVVRSMAERIAVLTQEGAEGRPDNDVV